MRGFQKSPGIMYSIGFSSRSSHLEPQIIYSHGWTTVDGPAKSDKPPILDGWNPINNGINHLATGDSDFTTIHIMNHVHLIINDLEICWAILIPWFDITMLKTFSLQPCRCAASYFRWIWRCYYPNQHIVHRELQVLIPSEDKADVITPINILFIGVGEFWSLMKIKLMLLRQSTYCS